MVHRGIETWRNKSSFCCQKLSTEISQPSVSCVNDMEYTGNIRQYLLFFLFMVSRLFFFFFPGWILFSWNRRCSKCQMSGWNGVCLQQTYCAGFQNLLVRKEETAFARTGRGEQALQLVSPLGCFSSLPCAVCLQMRLVRRKQWRKTVSTQEKWIGQNGSAVRNLYVLALAWGVLCP